MNIPFSWLKELVDIDVSIEDFSDKMTMTGTKVEAINYIGREIQKVVVGKILSIEKHKDADKLLVTKVDIGNKEIQIVTGATNIFKDALVPIALHGATLANGLKIKNSKLRGELSEGMMCSIEELGYTKEDYKEAPVDGIYILNGDYPLGSDVCKILKIKEDVIEFEITSNRQDCMSVLGIAREASAVYSKKLNFNIDYKFKKGENLKNLISVEVINNDLCKRYIGAVVKNIIITDSPLWIAHKLRSCGIKPVNNIVDITNYVMLELGQPIHAFDMDKINNKKIFVRNAKDNEKIKTLDGIERSLEKNNLVISDDKEVLAIAGIMGGESTKVTKETKNIFLEVAIFDNVNIRNTSKKLSLRTDASSKFEKELNINLPMQAVNRFMQLIEELNYGEVCLDIIDICKTKKEDVKIPYSLEKINNLLGTDISQKECVDILNRLFIETKDNIAYIPDFRLDLKTEVDIAEELIRIYGYEKIKPTLPKTSSVIGIKTKKQKIEEIIKNTTIALGFNEIISYSFESKKVFDKLNLEESSNLRNTVNIKNPLGEDFSIMKTSNLNSILLSLSLNYNRRNEEALLFEMSKVYVPKSLPLEELPKEKEVLTLGLCSSKDNNKDFYYIKSLVDEIFKVLNIKNKVKYFSTEKLSFMHPGRTCYIDIDGKNIGFIGEVHPLVQNNYEIGKRVYIANIDLDYIYNNLNISRLYKALPKFPSTSRDIAIVVKDEILSYSIESIIREKSGKIFESVELFDVYKGDKIEKDYKSLAYKIVFRDENKTLVEEQINNTMEKILSSLEEDFKAKLRR